jgi:hypothetical protein
MRLPFVSRERFDESQKRIADLEAQLKQAAADLLAAKIEAATVGMRVPSDVDPMMQPIPGRPTIATITAAANKAAEDRAKIPGAKGIADELREHQVAQWRRAVGK